MCDTEHAAGDVSPLSQLHLRWARAVAAGDMEAIRTEAARLGLASMATAIDAILRGRAPG